MVYVDSPTIKDAKTLKGKGVRTRRPPLREKVIDYNVPSTGSKSCKSTITIYCNTESGGIIPAPTTSLNTFPFPSAFPSLPNFPFPSLATSLDLPSTLPSRDRPSAEFSEINEELCATDVDVDVDADDEEDEEEEEDDIDDIAVMQHPNSPYVPWDPPERWEIFRPPSPVSKVSIVSGCYSRPYSRSGARAPEPTEITERWTSSGISAGWRRLRQKVKNIIRRLKNRFGTTGGSQRIPEEEEERYSLEDMASRRTVVSRSTLEMWLAAERTI